MRHGGLDKAYVDHGKPVKFSQRARLWCLINRRSVQIAVACVLLIAIISTAVVKIAANNKYNHVCRSEYALLKDMKEGEGPPGYVSDPVRASYKQKDYTEFVKQQTKYSYSELTYQGLKLESAEYYKRTQSADVTVIITHYNVSTLCLQLRSLVYQEVRPKHIWVVVYGEEEEKLLEILDFSVASHDPSVSISTVRSPHTEFTEALKFQMAIQAETKYIWAFDANFFPGTNVMEYFIRVASIPQYSEALLGGQGIVVPAPVPGSFRIPSVAAHALRIPDARHGVPSTHMLQVDYLTGMWFFPTTFAKIFFREKLDVMSASNIIFSYTLRKYYNIPTFVLPQEERKSSMYNCFPQLFDLIEQDSDDEQIESEMVWHLFQKGDHFQWMNNPMIIESIKRPLMIVVESRFQVSQMCSLLQRLDRASYFLVIASTEKQSCHTILSGCEGIPMSCSERMFGLFDLKLTGLDVQSEVYNSMRHHLKTFSPSVLMAVRVEDSPIYSAVSTAVKDYKSTATYNEDCAVEMLSFPPGSLPNLSWIASIPELDNLKHWNTPAVQIHVVTYNRPKSLRRLFNSLVNTDWFGDKVDLIVHVEANAPTSTYDEVMNAPWAYGSKTIHKRLSHVGLMSNIAESWYPSNTDEYAIFLEDDIEVSKYAYQWVKYSLMMYRYGVPADYSDHLFGISLYTPRLIEVTYPRKQFDPSTLFGYEKEFSPFLLQLPCSWGALYFPEHWLHFREFLLTRIDGEIPLEDRQVIIPGSVTNGWKESWKKFFMEIIWISGDAMLYPNFSNQTSFATNHLEAGVHTGKGNTGSKLKHDPLDFTVPLMKDSNSFYDIPNQRLPSFHSLPVLDLFHRQISDVDLLAHPHDAPNYIKQLEKIKRQQQGV